MVACCRKKCAESAEASRGKFCPEKRTTHSHSIGNMLKTIDFIDDLELHSSKKRPISKMSSQIDTT
jgi:hypothetical protein